VVSLWNVNDTTTSLLMQEFYRALKEDGKSPAVALQAAQNYLRKLPSQQLFASLKALGATFRGRSSLEDEGDGVDDQLSATATPLYWAPFILVGGAP
jgi:CHAT domain-containing protein